MLFRSESGLVPPGTVFLLLNLDMTRAAGAYNDGYADDLALVLSGPQANTPEPTSLAGVATGLLLGGAALRRRRRTA